MAVIHTQDADFTLICADVLDGLRSLEAGSVHCVVTSPPYFALRDYGVSGQLGLEGSIAEYVASMVGVFAEVRRVLRDDGTLWLNLGDAFDSKQMVGSPWRVAFALQADGWYLRSDIIWSKPNPMPESATDRPTKAHEYVFLLSKGARYFFDQEAVREKAEWARWGDQTVPKYNGTDTTTGWIKQRSKEELEALTGRNVRSVWDIATQPYPEAHFATYPEELVRRCVLAGSSERGCCPVCGKPWEREVERGEEREQRPSWSGEGNAYGVNGGNHKGRTGNWGAETRSVGWKPACNCQTSPMTSSSVSSAENSGTSRIASTTTQGLCAPSAPQGTIPEPIPCTVLDPFLGSGTTAYVARKHGRRSVGIELNPAYADLAARRMQQQSLLV